MQKRDVVLQLRDGFLHRISELNPCYVPLQYPLLFPYRKDGYRFGIVHSDVESMTRKRTHLMTYTVEFQKRGLPHAH
ncbi:hypothetical protein ACS0TY_024116 [Phlomoides rotata]